MKKILIIEDEEQIRRVLIRVLSDEDKNLDVKEATNGKEGLSLIKKEKFDLVLCDIKMRKMDGIEVLQEVKKIKFSKQIILI